MASLNDDTTNFTNLLKGKISEENSLLKVSVSKLTLFLSLQNEKHKKNLKLRNNCYHSRKVIQKVNNGSLFFFVHEKAALPNALEQYSF